MQPPDYVKLRDRFAVTGGGRRESFFKRHSVSARSVFLAPKSAQAPSSHANIRRIDVAVDVEVCLVAMHPLTDPVGQPTDGQDVTGPVEGKRIGLLQAFTREDFIFDRDEARIVSLEWVRSRHQ